MSNVSPASAGIDPRTKPQRSSTESFPRVRGDRPRHKGGNVVEYRFPPRPRG